MMKDLDDLLGIPMLGMPEREKQRESRIRQHCLGVKRFQSGINPGDIYPFRGEISRNADYAGNVTAKGNDGQNFCFYFRVMRGMAKDPFINSVGELCETPWFILTLIAKSPDDTPLTKEGLAAAEAFKKEHHFPLTCAIIEIIEIMTRKSS